MHVQWVSKLGQQTFLDLYRPKLGKQFRNARFLEVFLHPPFREFKVDPPGTDYYTTTAILPRPRQGPHWGFRKSHESPAVVKT